MGEEKRDPDSGEFQSQISDEEILDVVSKLDPAGTVEIAEEIEITQQAAYYRLSNLQDQGELESKTIGGNRIWMCLENSS